MDPFNVDLASERTMYSGLKEGLQAVIETVGCSDLEARSTLQYPDNARSSTGQTRKICPDLGIYSTSCPDPDVQDSVPGSVDPIELLRVLYISMEVPVEVKHEAVECATASSTGTTAIDTPPSSCASIPASLPQPASASEADVSISSPEGGATVPLGLKGHCGRKMDYVIELYSRQHRLFVFMILFVNEKGWLLRFDRTGVSMTPDVDYTQHPEVIGKSLYRLSRSRHAMGHDPTATPANAEDTALFRSLHTQYHPQSTVARGLKDAAMDRWPVYKLSFECPFSPDQSKAVRRNSPLSQRAFLVGKPMSVSRSLFGRGTKAHVAYDVATKKIVVIKDSWRPNSRNIRSEYDTYLLLNAIDADETTIDDIPTLLGGGDVVYQGVVQETRTSNPDLLTRIHFRLVLKEVCRPLEDFEDSLELVIAIQFALGAHFVAWTAAHVLHRDVSVGNILILDEDPEKPPNAKRSKGLLADWDLAKTKDELDNPVLTQKTRTGTWPFISARLQHTGPEQHHELSDDLESFVHVLNYCAMNFLPNKLSKDDVRFAQFISNVYDYVRESGGLNKSSHEKLELLVGNKPFVELEDPNHPLTSLLRTLSELCWQHYHHIQFPPPKSFHPLSGRTPEGPVSSPLMRLVQQSSVPRLRPPATPVRTLPAANPDQSPLRDHSAIAQEFVRATDASFKVQWPPDKVKRTKPLVLPVAASRSGKRQSGAPSYASYGVEEPRFSNPAKRARTATTDSRGSQDSRDSPGRASGSAPAKPPKTSSRRKTRSEKSPAQFIDPMSMRSREESRRSRSTTPESQGMFGDVDDDLDMDDLEPGTHDSEAQAPASARGHQYAERISDMAAGLDDIQFG